MLSILASLNYTDAAGWSVQDPYLAIVVDPVRTMASGKVEIGAFR